MGLLPRVPRRRRAGVRRLADAPRGTAEPTAAQDPTTRVNPVAALPSEAPPERQRVASGTPRRRPSGDERTRIAGQLSFEEDDERERPSWDDFPPRDR